MIQLVFGLGKIGIQTKLESGDVKIYLGTLTKKHEPGDSYEDEDLKQQEVLLTFLNEAGLDVLLEALEACKEFGFRKIPDELRMGA